MIGQRNGQKKKYKRTNNAHKQQGNFTTTAGTDNKMNDVWFDVDNFRKVA